MAMHAAKTETQKQWDQDPCGAVTAGSLTPGTVEFYREVRRSRYQDYAPWMPKVMDWAAWSGRDVLEIGVGLGSDHLSFAEQGARMTALDLSREHLRHTQSNLQLHGCSTTAVYGDAECMPFADNSFDLVYSFGVLHHTPDTQQSIREVHRVLRPGGTALITLYHRNSWFFWVQLLGHQGLLKGRLFTRGLHNLMSEIEYRADPNSATPLVKVFSRGSGRRLFHSFSELAVSTHQVEPSHFSVLHRALARLPRAALERRLRRGGWYLVLRARK